MGDSQGTAMTCKVRVIKRKGVAELALILAIPRTRTFNGYVSHYYNVVLYTTPTVGFDV